MSKFAVYPPDWPLPYLEPRFLMIPALGQGQRWRFVGVVDHPFFKHGPLLQWSGSHGVVMINRQLFYMMMTGRMEMEK